MYNKGVSWTQMFIKGGIVEIIGTKMQGQGGIKIFTRWEDRRFRQIFRPE